MILFRISTRVGMESVYHDFMYRACNYSNIFKVNGFCDFEGNCKKTFNVSSTVNYLWLYLHMQHIENLKKQTYIN